MTRKEAAGRLGYRQATRAELATLGFSPGSRRYVKAAPGRVTKRSKSYPRRQVEQAISGRSFEASAKARALQTRGASRMSLSLSGERLPAPVSRYGWYLQEWAAAHGQTLGQARSDPERKRLWRGMREARKRVQRAKLRGASPSSVAAADRALAPNGAYARALEAIGARRPDYSWKVGDTPKYSGAPATRFDTYAA